MALKGAQVLNVTMPNGRVEPCVCIPAAYNDMVRTKDGKREIVPYLNIRAWDASSKFVEACRRRHESEEDYVPPSHTIKASWSSEFRQRVEAAVRSRMKAQNPDATEEDIKAELAKATNVSLGDLTPMLPPPPKGYIPTESVATSAYDAGAEATGGEVSASDDLPF